MKQSHSGRIHDSDVAFVETRLQTSPETRSVAGFVPGPGIARLALSFDIDELRAALARRSDVNVSGGRIMYLSGGRQVTPLQLDTLPATGPALVQAMIRQADVMLADLDSALACMTAVTDVDVTTP